MRTTQKSESIKSINIKLKIIEQKTVNRKERETKLSIEIITDV